jgi:predicted TIM-barrel fold metal-dependent hydrolase
MSELKSYIDSIPFIDTHSHVAGFDYGTPVDDKAGRTLPQILFNDYLLYLSPASGELPEGFAAKESWRVEDAEADWRMIQPLLDRMRATTSYITIREGIRALHPFDEPDITDANWRRINDSIVAAYQKHGERAWHRMAIERTGVILQNQMAVLSYVCDHYDALPPAERAAQKKFLMPSLILDGHLFTGFSSGKPSRLRAMELVGMQPKNHAEYVEFCRRSIDLFAERGGKSVKLLTAYHRPLRFEEAPDDEAARLYAEGPETLRGAKLHRLQDNLVYHLLERAKLRGLPLIVHTGYNCPVDFAKPDDLLPFVKNPRTKGLKIDLCHSGWPSEGAAMIFARTFREVYFNLCWTPVLSRALGRRVLSEAIDIMPMSKVLTGTDCGTVECFVGAVRLIRDQLHEVLSEKIAQKQITPAVAERFARCILHDNAADFYGPLISPQI